MPSSMTRPWGLLLMVAACGGWLAAGCGNPRVDPVKPGAGDGGGGAAGDGGAGGNGPPSPTFRLDGAVAPDGGVAPRPPTSGEQCAEEAITGQLVPVDLLLLLDGSGSMNLVVAGKTRWATVTEALLAFARDPRSSGLGVGLQTFPFTISAKPCTSDADCGFPGNMGRLYWCSRPFLCVGPGSPAATARVCDPNDAFCPAGTDCLPSGRCSASGARCLELGRPCPGGAAGDMCGDAPLTCKAPVDSCEVGDYARPRVPIVALPGQLPMLSQGIAAITPAGNTPIAPAVAGAARYLREHLAARPGRRGVLVLASDVSPNVCTAAGGNAVNAVVAAIEAARTATPSLSTYVIGAVRAGDAIRAEAANRFAAAGGTGMPFIVNDTAADLGDRFLSALSAIRGSALPCEFRIPTPRSGVIDYGKVNVRYNSPAGPVDLLYVGSADRCHPMRGGWYYDVDPARGTPTAVRACEATCARFKAEVGGAVELRFGCQTRIE
jgi:hypothetical protein